MCGIVAYAGIKPTNLFGDVFDSYGAQSTRGTKGYGMAIVYPDYSVQVVRAVSEAGIVTRSMELFSKGKKSHRAILFHHRFPTSTENTIGTTHPFFISHESLDFDYLIIHNGVISNDTELHAQHLKDGFKYKSVQGNRFNDSEAGSIELARALENPAYEIQSTGGQAYAALILDKVTKKAVSLVFVTNGSNPIKYKWYEGRSVELASDLSPGGYSAEASKLYTFNFETGGLVMSDVKFKPGPVYTRRYVGGYGIDDDYPYRGHGSGTVGGHGYSSGVSSFHGAQGMAGSRGVTYGAGLVPSGTGQKTETTSTQLPLTTTKVPGKHPKEPTEVDRHILSLFSLVRELKERLSDSTEVDQVDPNDFTKKLGVLVTQATEAAQLARIAKSDKTAIVKVDDKADDATLVVNSVPPITTNQAS